VLDDGTALYQRLAPGESSTPALRAADFLFIERLQQSNTMPTLSTDDYVES